MDSNKSQKRHKRPADAATVVAECVKKFDRMLSDFGEMIRATAADGDGLTAGQASMRHIVRGRL
ncbi:hypothetical protein [uncultured Selenomonas sp.]|uniref:hypothetical protein n=1 Tax=uncultured Selenomonas sp. TaxID=159275 RepID=UPI0025E14F6D|nr:hypothetical protein [uncultured Selenomonas sp.]